MSVILAATPTFNEKNGNGRYKPLRKRRKAKTQEEKDNEFRYLKNSDLRMRFNSAKDPIYYAFDFLEQRSVSQLMGDFVQDSFFEITNFVSKVIK